MCVVIFFFRFIFPFFSFDSLIHLKCNLTSPKFENRNCNSELIGEANIATTKLTRMKKLIDLLVTKITNFFRFINCIFMETKKKMFWRRGWGWIEIRNILFKANILLMVNGIYYVKFILIQFRFWDFVYSAVTVTLWIQFIQNRQWIIFGFLPYFIGFVHMQQIITVLDLSYFVIVVNLKMNVRAR